MRGMTKLNILSGFVVRANLVGGQRTKRKKKISIYRLKYIILFYCLAEYLMVYLVIPIYIPSICLANH